MQPNEESTTAEPAFDKDSMANTFITAAVVCLVCSLLISTAAVALKSMQDRNIKLDKMKNILSVAGFSSEEIERKGIEEIFGARVKSQLINLETGAIATEEEMAPVLEALKIPSFEEAMVSYDQIKASKTGIDSCAFSFKDKKADIAGLQSREKYSHVYLLMDEATGETVEKYVFPVRGYGLWSTLKGFLAVETDFQTIAGLTYYEHAETPGLGGEVDNPSWKAKWKGKKIYQDNGDVQIAVVKGAAANEFGVDGLSGATITSNGVTNMLKYWLGPQGFGPFIDKRKTGAAKAAAGLLPKLGGSNG